MQQLRSTYFPYCIQQVMPGWFVILNTDYKPLGFPRGEIVDYRDHMVRIKYFTAAKAKRLSYKGSDDVSFISLYNDSCIPTRSPEYEAAYLKRLSILFNLKIDEDAVKPPKQKTTQKTNKSRKVKNITEGASPLFS